MNHQLMVLWLVLLLVAFSYCIKFSNQPCAEGKSCDLQVTAVNIDGFSLAVTAEYTLRGEATGLKAGKVNNLLKIRYHNLLWIRVYHSNDSVCEYRGMDCEEGLLHPDSDGLYHFQISVPNRRMASGFYKGWLKLYHEKDHQTDWMYANVQVQFACDTKKCT